MDSFVARIADDLSVLHDALQRRDVDSARNALARARSMMDERFGPMRVRADLLLEVSWVLERGQARKSRPGGFDVLGFRQVAARLAGELVVAGDVAAFEAFMEVTRERTRVASELDAARRHSAYPSTMALAFTRSLGRRSIEDLQGELADVLARLDALSDVDSSLTRMISTVHPPTALSHALDDVEHALAHVDEVPEPVARVGTRLELAIELFESASGLTINPTCASGRS